MGRPSNHCAVVPEEPAGQKLIDVAAGCFEENFTVAKLGFVVLYGALAHFNGSCPQNVHGFRHSVVENVQFE
ncbi:hypothetical protein D3C72_1915530 [compost metagenome]